MIIEVYPLTKQAQNAVEQLNGSSDYRKLMVLVDGNNRYAPKTIVDGMLNDSYWEKFHNVIQNYVNKVQPISIDWNPPTGNFPLPHN